MRKYILALVSFVAAFQLAFVPAMVHAQSSTGGLLNSAGDQLKNTGLGGDTQAESGRLLTIVGNLVKAVLGLMGIVFVLLIVYAGFLWMTAGGDSKKVDSAKAIIKNCIVGLVIMVLAYSITSYVFTAIGKATA